MIPLRIGSSETFATARNYLRNTGYSEDFLKKHFKVPAIEPLLAPRGRLADFFRAKYEGDDPALFLARVFIGGFVEDRVRFNEKLPVEVMSAFLDLGLLAEFKNDLKQLRSTVLMYPAEGKFIVADAGGRLEGGAGYTGQDFVMSGTEDVCRDFIEAFGKSPCKRFLDMGTGSGLAALVGSDFAESVWAVDITERAVKFANFNRLLNGAEHVTVLEGDLFAPVKGLQFDRIVSNPPFEPPLKSHMIFSEGGADGEAILGRLIQESPDLIVPGGRLYANICATDREGESFEQRVLRWLGKSADDFDVALFTRLEMKPESYSIHQILGDNLDSWKLQDFNLFYNNLRAYHVILGQLVIQRRFTARPVFRVRRKYGPQTSTPEMEWLLDWETRCTEPGFDEVLFGSRPQASARWELVAKHAYRDGRLAPLSYAFTTKYPFDVELSVAPWIAMTVADCNGKNTVAELYEALRKKAPVPREEFVAAIKALIGSQFVTVEAVPATEPVKPLDAKRHYWLE